MKKPDYKLALAICEDKNGDLLFQAVRNNNTERLRELIEHKVDISLIQNDQSCFQYAATLGYWKCVLVLLDAALLGNISIAMICIDWDKYYSSLQKPTMRKLWKKFSR